MARQKMEKSNPLPDTSGHTVPVGDTGGRQNNHYVENGICLVRYKPTGESLWCHESGRERQIYSEN